MIVFCLKEGETDKTRIEKIVKHLIGGAFSPPCSSTEYNTTGSGLASIGAVQQQTTDATVCRAQCTLDATCVSYQIETSGTSIICWFQRSSANLQNRYSRPNVIEYIKYCANPTTSVSTTVHPLEVSKWVDDVSCRLLAGERDGSVVQMRAESNISLAIIYAEYMMRCLRVHINTCVRRLKRINSLFGYDGCFKSMNEEHKDIN
ncbi:hypothetical protein HELRODRAFT_169096 [Helobdella robusta]|uniref:Apple domain-containing protein n=1 Tax=Helobdella robusta TaxID=6412 RepID=T1F1E1_HELRO|nr:hypothetical protein HELRODRAFT_169096 [Helobdella robusta]ESO09152.1 hypothetical protein HELRODRAFT_169096 [Helobdella robusta]